MITPSRSRSWKASSKTHPGHLNALTYLGYAYNGAGDIDRAIDYQSLVTSSRNTVVDVRTLAAYLQRKGRYQESIDLLRSFVQNVEDAWNVHQILAYSYGYLRNFDEALAEARITFQGNPRMRSVEFEMLVFKDDLAGAEALTGPEQVCLDRGRFAANIDFARKELVNARAQGTIDDVAAAKRRLAFALEKAGRYAEALAEHGEYLRLSAESRASAGQSGLPYRPIFRKPDLFVKARIQAEMGDAGEALKTAEELKSVIDSGINRKELKYYEYILGLVELGKGNPARAAELVRERVRAPGLRGLLDFRAGHLPRSVRRGASKIGRLRQGARNLRKDHAAHDRPARRRRHLCPGLLLAGEDRRAEGRCGDGARQLSEVLSAVAGRRPGPPGSRGREGPPGWQVVALFLYPCFWP